MRSSAVNIIDRTQPIISSVSIEPFVRCNNHHNMAVQTINEHTSSMAYTFPLILPLIGATVGLTMLYWYSINKRVAKYGNLLPGPPTLPFIGNAHYVIGKTHNRKQN